MKFLAFLLGALAFVAQANAQGTVLQAGPATAGHTSAYISSGIITDAGPASGGGVGVGLSELLLAARAAGTPPFANAGTGPYNTNFCGYDGPTTAAAGYHYLCMSANAQGGGLVAYGAGGAASALPFSFIVNGTTYQFPFVTGGIVGPGSTTASDLACWNNTVGTLLKDCTALPSGTTIPAPLLSSPVLSGTATGTYTLAGTPTITAPTITTPTVSSPVFSGTATGTYTLAGTPTITAPVLSGSLTGTYTLAGTPTLGATLTATGQVITGGTFQGAAALAYLGYTADQGGAQKLQVSGGAFLSGTLAIGANSGAGSGSVAAGATNGLALEGSGSTYDVLLLNKSAASVLGIPTGTQNITVQGSLGAGGYISGAFSNGNAQLAASATNGLVLQGKGSVNDVLINNGGGSAVMTVSTGTQNVTFGGHVTHAADKYSATPIAIPGAGATATFAHGLGAAPTIVNTLAVETDAGGECGYIQNEIIVLPTALGSAVNQTTSYNATNIYVVISSSAVIDITNKTNGALCTITNAKWNLLVKASL